jgi:triacylglycerol lipase
MPAPEGVYCQSIGSVVRKASGGTFPLNFSYRLVRRFSGENDGLVSEDAFRWGEKYTLLRPTKRRGISHGDIIDLNRANLRGFDVREFYVELVNDLKNRGL